MIIKSIELADYRNYDSLVLQFDRGTNILYGDNAQGKTNILEAIYVAATTKSHKGSKDREIVNFDKEEAHIRTYLEKDGKEIRVDMHLRKSKSKGIAIDGQKIKKAADLLGLCNVVFFSPEDLGIIKNGPAERRRFVDMELCQLDNFYLYNLNHYNKIVNQRNKLLKIVLPSSVPLILSVMKVNIGLCLVGVIIGEFIGARKGLGYLIIYGSQTFRLTWVLMSIVILCIIAMLLYFALYLIEKQVRKH